jgi:hypothetical protein
MIEKGKWKYLKRVFCCVVFLKERKRREVEDYGCKGEKAIRSWEGTKGFLFCSIIISRERERVVRYEQCGPHPIIMCNVVVVNGVQWIFMLVPLKAVVSKWLQFASII